jgi:hypothetical protein
LCWQTATTVAFDRKALLRDCSLEAQRTASGELEGRLATLEPAFVIALEGLRPNPGHARIAADQKTA